MHNACTIMTGVPKNIQIRNVPDDVHSVLTERAASLGQSLQEYLLARLTAHAATRSNKEIWERVERERQEHREWFTTVKAAQIIREDRDSR